MRANIIQVLSHANLPLFQECASIEELEEIEKKKWSGEHPDACASNIASLKECFEKNGFAIVDDSLSVYVLVDRARVDQAVFFSSMYYHAMRVEHRVMKTASAAAMHAKCTLIAEDSKSVEALFRGVTQHFFTKAE